MSERRASLPHTGIATFARAPYVQDRGPASGARAQSVIALREFLNTVRSQFFDRPQPGHDVIRTGTNQVCRLQVVDSTSPQSRTRTGVRIFAPVPDHLSQFSTFRAGTRWNSATLSVTQTASRARAWAAISMSCAPIGVPFFSSATRIEA